MTMFPKQLESIWYFEIVHEFPIQESSFHHFVYFEPKHLRKTVAEKDSNLLSSV